MYSSIVYSRTGSCGPVLLPLGRSAMSGRIEGSGAMGLSINKDSRFRALHLWWQSRMLR